MIPRVSVALASYNGAQFLGEQLKSLAEQTRLPDELVVSDDGSRDETIAILEDFRARAPFEVRILRNKVKLGYAGNFNRALAECTGGLVFLADQDDWWFAGKLASMERWAQEAPDCAIFACDAELTNAELSPSGRSKRGQIAALGLPETDFVMGCCLAIRKEFLDLALPIPKEVAAHDTWLVELADHFGLVERKGDILQYYRQHDNNVSNFSANTTVTIDFAHRTRLWGRSLSRRLRGQGGLSRELAMLRLEVAHIFARQSELMAIVGADRVARGITILQGRIAQLEARSAVRAVPLPGRLFAIAKNWKQAGYGGRAGVAGAVRDFFTYVGHE